METVLTAFIIIFVVLFAALTLSQAIISSQDMLQDSWQAMEARRDEQARTSLTPVGGEVAADASVAEVTLHNDGSTRIGNFDLLDVVVQYYDDSEPSAYHVDWLPYVGSNPAQNQWTLAGIYQDVEKKLAEVYEPGILNPGEEMTIQLVVAHPVGQGKEITVDVATDNGASASVTFTRNLPPQLVTNTGATVLNGRSVVITPDMLAADDADGAAESLIYTITTPPAQGMLSLGDSFTQADINDGLLLYSHTGSGPDSFEFTVSDGTDSIGTFTFDVAVDLPPMLVANTGIKITPGSTVLINRTLLEAIDGDNDPAELVYTVTTPPVRGELSLGTNFTQADINSGNLTYAHAIDGPDSFQFTVSDGITVIGAYTFAISY